MSELTLNKEEISKWFRDRGDYTHNITYDLTEESVVIDLGGYTGVWAKQIIDKYNPNVYLLEPIKEFHDGMVNKFKDNPKVKILNVGVSTENKNGILYFSADGTSSQPLSNNSIEVKFNTMESVLDNWGLTEIDLLQVNIEGDEYPLLENMIDTGLISKFKNVQIQFHYGIENDVRRRELIQNGLREKGYEIKFNYPFVWESWRKK